MFKYICVCVSVCIWGPRVYRKLSLQEPTNLRFELVSYWDLNPLICLDGQPASPMGPLVSAFPVGRVQVRTTMPSLFYMSIVNQTQALLCHMIYGIFVWYLYRSWSGLVTFPLIGHRIG